MNAGIFQEAPGGDQPENPIPRRSRMGLCGEPKRQRSTVDFKQ
jgi:hypothetical protein